MVRTVPDLAKAMQPLEDAIRQKFIPALLGRSISDRERELFSLPARFAGLGIANPCTQSEKQFKNSEELTAPLLELILAHRKLNAKHMRKTQGLYSGNTKKSDRGRFGRTTSQNRRTSPQ